MMTMDVEAARAALHAKHGAEHDLARVATCPPWRHAAFAALIGALVLSPAFPFALRIATFVAILAGIVLLIRSDRRRMGVFVNGYRRGRTRRVTFPLLAIVLGLYALSVYASLDCHRPAISVAAAVATFAIGYAGSVLWQRVFRRELGLD